MVKQATSFRDEGLHYTLHLLNEPSCLGVHRADCRKTSLCLSLVIHLFDVNCHWPMLSLALPLALPPSLSQANVSSYEKEIADVTLPRSIPKTVSGRMCSRLNVLSLSLFASHVHHCYHHGHKYPISILIFRARSFLFHTARFHLL